MFNNIDTLSLNIASGKVIEVILIFQQTSLIANVFFDVQCEHRLGCKYNIVQYRIHA